MTIPDHAIHDSRREAYVSLLSRWIAIPSVSGSPEHDEAVEESAAWFAEQLSATGFPQVDVVRSQGGAPAVLATWPGPAGAPRVLVYGHHDVQPVGDPNAWETPPFEAVHRGDRVIGRGSVDDKGQLLFHLLAAREHVASWGGGPGIHLMVLAEGEEEVGSPTLAALLAEHREELSPDLIVVSDTGIWSREHPTVCLGMRGVLRMRVQVAGGEQDVHAGSFGGAVRNPATELARFLASLHGDDGRVAVAGFYDDVLDVGERERAKYAALPLDETAWLGPAAAAGIHGEAGYSTLERVWVRPTAEVNAVRAGDLAGPARTIVPASAEAHLSFRLVAHQQPERVAELVRAHAARVFGDDVRWEMDADLPGVAPCGVADGHWALEELLGAMVEEFGVEPGYTRDGGSGPGATLEQGLGAPVIFVGMGRSSDGAHGPNESVSVELMLRGARVTARLWDRLARMERTTSRT